MVVVSSTARLRRAARTAYNLRLFVPPFLSLRGTSAQADHTSGPLAQLAEQQTLNLLVEGSIPSGLTNSSHSHLAPST